MKLAAWGAGVVLVAMGLGCEAEAPPARTPNDAIPKTTTSAEPLFISNTPPRGARPPGGLVRQPQPQPSSSAVLVVPPTPQ